MKTFDKYNLVEIKSENHFHDILINEDKQLYTNNLIFDCSVFNETIFESSIQELEKISLTLATHNKTFIVIHPLLPTDKWDEFILIPTLNESIEYIFMEELTRDF